MTTDTSSQAIPTESSEDPRHGYATAGSIAATVIAGVGPNNLRAPTPCPEFDVEALTRHLLSIGHRTLAIGRGEPAEAIPLDAPGVAVADFAADWARSMAEQRVLWADDHLLAQPMVLPFGTLPGGLALSVYTAEILVHTWDLATALGLSPDWDQALAADALLTVQMGVPAQGRGPDMPFDPVTPTADDAPAINRLVAWLGRKP